MLQFLKSYKWWLAGCMVFGFIVLTLPTFIVNRATMARRYNMNRVNDVPARAVTIVLGAGVKPDGQPTPYLKWRIETAVELYKMKRTKKLLMTGDNSTKHYNEPVAMKRYAIGLGVKSEDIVLDYAGFSTYDSCYRAKAIFDIRQAIVVSQGYHLPRAIATCMGLGVDVVGVAAKHEGRDFTVTYIMREYIATDKALVEILMKPHPKLLGEKISL